MSSKNIERHLLDISIQALGYVTDSSPDLFELIELIELACRHRQIVGPVQFEDFWQNEEQDNQAPQLFLQYKFSSAVLRRFQEKSQGMHQFSWELVLPHVNYLDKNKKPTDSVGYLMLGSVQYESSNGEGFADEDVLDFLEEITNALSNS
jgi:hypothetical protein